MSVYSVAEVFYGEFRFGCWKCYQIITHSDQFFCTGCTYSLGRDASSEYAYRIK